MKEIMICKSVSSFTLRGNSNGLQETLNDFSTKVTLAATFSLSGIFRVIVRQKTLLLMVLPGLLFRSSTAASVQIELAQFSAGAGARFTGSELSYAGFDVAIVGDHNGDGFTDYIFGASGQAMAVIVMKKNTVNTDMSLSSIVSGQYFRVIKAPTGSNFGSVLGGIGDINGDSFDDVIIGAATGAVPSRSTAGYAFVIFGMQGPFTDLVLTNDWVASSLGFMISGPASQSRFAGTFRTARGLGDVNGDGIGDFAVAATRYSGTTSRTQAGVVWVVFGQNTSVYSNVDTLLVPDNFGSSGVHYTGESDFGRLGQSIATAGDFNGDGITDFLMGAPNLTPNARGSARTGAGAAYLIHGSKTALASTDLSTFVTGSMGVRFVGAWGGDNLGNALSGVGDINGDGMDDIALGAVYAVPLSRNLGGILYVIFGTRDAFTADVDLQAFTVSSQGFAVYGSAAGMSLGTVAPAGDVDGDGVNDIFVGGVQRNSLTHIVYGQREVRTANVDTLTDDVTTFSLDGGGHLGYALAGGEDLNGDGIVDILLGAHSANVEPTGGGSTLSEAGIVFMVPGPFVLPSKAPVVSPTMPPVATPTMEPTLPPTLPPTETPSQTPSETPSAVPSVQPSAVPSASPSAAPSTDPSLAPSAAPQVSPTVTPSAYPTQAPSATPSAGPTVHPTALPSAEPSLAPSVSPTLTPSVEPSVNPTVHPTCVPTVVPSAVPTLVPSANPTVFADRDFKLTVDVEQELLSVTKDEYDAQKAVANRTIQHTVADAIDIPGVVPERVTDIVVEEEEEERRRLIGHATLSGPSVLLKYKITVFDPTVTVEKLSTDLVQAVQEGRMDTFLRFYATQFGATSLGNVTLGEPRVTSTAAQSDGSADLLTGVQVALVVISVVVGLALLIAIVWFALRQKQIQTQPSDGRPTADGRALEEAC